MKLRLTVVAMTALFLSQAATASDVLILHGMAPSFGNETVSRQVGIRTDDVNPAEPTGAATLMARIRHGADVVCSGAIRMNPEKYAEKIAACRTKVIAQAVHDVGTPAIEYANAQ